MFPSGVGFGELVVIGIVLLLVVGPKKLPDVAKDVGKGLKTIRKVSNQLRDSAEVDELKRAVYGEPGHTPAWKRSVSEHLNDLMEGDERPVYTAAAAAPPPRAAHAVTETPDSAQALDHGTELDEHDDDGRPVPRAGGPAAAVAAVMAAEAEAYRAAPAAEVSPAALPAALPGNGPTNGEQSV
jgi:Tat protein translocase TatB subunit